MPIGIKMIKGDKAEAGETVTDLRPAVYQDGAISMQKALEQGKSLIQVTAEGVPPLHYEYHLRVEMINYADVFRATIGPLIGLLLTAILGYKLIRSRRFRDWMASRGSKRTEKGDEGEKSSAVDAEKHQSTNKLKTGNPSDVSRKNCDNKANSNNGHSGGNCHVYIPSTSAWWIGVSG